MSALIPEHQKDLIFPDKLIRARPKQDVIDPTYLWKILQTVPCRTQIESYARTAVGNYAIGGQDVWKIEIPLPPKDVQKQLVQAVREKEHQVKELRLQALQLVENARQKVEEMILGVRPWSDD